MKDERLYAKFTLDFPDHPKILTLSVEAKWALVEMTIYSRRHMTDGWLSKPVALAKWGASVCSELASNDPANPSLIESEKGYQLHDFAAHQSTKAEIEALTEKRRAAGQKGGKARAKQVPQQNSSKIKPETETETETEPTYVGSSLTSRNAREPIPDDWQPSLAHQARASRDHLDLTAEADAFRNHALSVDRRCAGRRGWDAAFANWLGKAKPAAATNAPTSAKAQGWLDIGQQALNNDQRAIGQ